MQKWFCYSILFFSWIVGNGQELSGIVRDAVDGAPLVGATVVLDDSVQFSVTDDAGHYLFEEVTPGRHQLKISSVGYKSGILSDVWMKNGKVTTENIDLNRDYTSLDEVVVTEPVRLSEIGKMTISEEQINRFAATYYDPARLVTISPDVAISNDQNNQISVRGISPNYNTWRLEGVEIVNPNHLSNAGTFSDQPTSTGGGVNILSAQMLDHSSFLYGGFSTEYGNSVGGIFDMGLRTGNQKERQYTAQASLIGLDFSAEGPFSKNSKASYIANYRYSFTGLLTSMGVDFGGESIGFQDLSFNVNLPMSEKASISVFGVGGLNFNNFDSKDFDESEVQKDRSDIYYSGKMGAMGVHLDYQLGNGTFNISAAYSTSDNERDQTTYDSDQNDIRQFNTALVNEILSINGKYNFELGKGDATLGVIGNNYHFSYYRYDIYYTPFQFNLSVPSIVNDKTDVTYYAPYVSFDYPISQLIRLSTGVTYNLNSGGDQRIDPRGTLTFFTGDRSEFYLSAGLYSQQLNPNNYYFVYPTNGGDYYAPGEDYNFIQSSRFLVGYNQQWTSWHFSSEAFYYLFPEIHVNANPNDDAKSYGISMMLDKSFTSDWYLNLGGSLFESTWGDNRNSRYNLKHNLNISGGKEWFFTRKGLKRALSVNAKIIHQGGLIDPIAEIPSLQVTTNNNDYFRVDLRVQWTKYREKMTTSIALDLQNATNQQNDAYQYYDSFTGQYEQATQLGMIPILTYRVEF